MRESDEIKSASMESSLQLQTCRRSDTRIRESRNICFELSKIPPGSHRRHCTSVKDFYDIFSELYKNQRSRNGSGVAELYLVPGIIAFCSNAPIGILRDNLSYEWLYPAMESLLQMVKLKNTSNHLQQVPWSSNLTTLPKWFLIRFPQNETRSILQIIYRENVGKKLPKMLTSRFLHLAGQIKEALHTLARSKAKPENTGLFSANSPIYFSPPSTSSSEEVITQFTFPRKMKKWHPLAILANGDTSTNINDFEPLKFLPFFHKALKNDVEHLISISARLAEDVGRLTEFRRLFNILRQRHRLYGDAKGRFIIPALEAKAKLQNISWSYTFDHELEAKYLDKVSVFLDEMDNKRMNVAMLCSELCSTCQSFHRLLCDHISAEGNELWLLFGQCFSVKEQEKIIANILGRTSAKAIQAIIPWLNSCLPPEEQQVMMSSWRKIARNTMFDDWLEEWWFGYRTDHAEEPSSSSVLRYLSGRECLVANIEMLENCSLSVTDQDSAEKSSQKLFRKQNLHAQAANSPESNNIPGKHPSYRDPFEQTFGCRHYKRSCKLLTSCCNQLYTCIRCHDEESDHSTKRRAISEMMCMKCLIIQPIAQKCATDSCNSFSMGRYYCSVCKLFDDDREIYHCPYCNLCRVGKGLGIEYFHCMNCNACMSESLSVHVCREKCFEDNCPICHEYIFTSSVPVKALPCGHLMHSTCFKEYTCSRYTCPICSKSLGDMQVYFRTLDDMLAAEEIPEEYSGKQQAILCNDCEKKGAAAFHWVHHKCSSCGSYNTRLI